MWDLFKIQVKSVMENSPQSLDLVAKIIATAYDNAVKSLPAGDILYKNPIEQGNVVLLENIIKMVLTQQQSSPVQLPIINGIANGFIAYWSSATLSKMLTPPIPAPGTTLNLNIVQNLVANPGMQVSIPFTYEGLDNVDGFLNKLIQAADIHLYTVSGVTMTNSVYPPGVNGIGFIPWNGFSVGGNTQDYAETYLNMVDQNAAYLNELKQKFGNGLVDPTEISALLQSNIDALKAANQPPSTAGGGFGGVSIKGSVTTNLSALENAAIQGGINNPQLIIAIQANALKETGGQVIVENTNYSNQTREELTKIFGDRVRRLSDAELNAIKATPESFANYMYGRPGNSLGNNQPGDGYKFRGRGFVQITGRANYAALSKALYGDDRLVKNPDLLNSPEESAKATIWFVNRSLPTFAKKMNLDPNNLTQEQATHLVTSIVAGKVIPKNGTGFLTTTALGNANNYAAQLVSQKSSSTLLASNTTNKSGGSIGG